MEAIKKKVITVIPILFVIVFISFNVFQYVRANIHSELLTELEGNIYFTQRIDDVMTLFKSDASLENKTLIYSHKGEEKDSEGNFNDNIIDFHVEEKTQTMLLLAMHSGSWTLFSLKKDGNEPSLIKEKEELLNTDYIKNKFKNITVSSKEGSIYLIESEEEKTIKKFYGFYDKKLTGDHPIGFSPDGDYLVYQSATHLTPFGAVLEGIFTDFSNHVYIMNLSTMESTRFADTYQIQ